MRWFGEWEYFLRKPRTLVQILSNHTELSVDLCTDSPGAIRVRDRRFSGVYWVPVSLQA